MDAKEFFKLDFPYKLILVVLAIQLPFWYICLYLFHKQFYQVQTFYLLLSVCLAFSIMYAVGNLISSAGILKMSKKGFSDRELLATWVIFFMVAKLALFMVLAFWLKWDLYCFLRWIFGLQAVLTFFGIVGLINHRTK